MKNLFKSYKFVELLIIAFCSNETALYLDGIGMAYSWLILQLSNFIRTSKQLLLKQKHFV